MLLALSWILACTGTNDKTPDTGTSETDTDADTDTDTDTDTVACNTDNEACAPHTCGGEGSRMLPGADCVSCHSRNSGEDEAPIWTFAGTAFADMDGTRPLAGAIIRITGSDGGTPIEMTTNSVGNFYTSDRVPDPFTAEIEVDGETRSMSAEQTYGGCNSCHACEGEAGGKLTGP